MTDMIGAITKGLIKTTAAEPHSGGAFHALGRLFVVCASPRHEPQLLGEDLDCRQLAAVTCGSIHHTMPSMPAIGNSMLIDLAEGPYLHIAAFLNKADLGCVDATCRPLRELNRAHHGSWYMLGVRTFYGLELDGEGLFQGREQNFHHKQSRVDWKGRYLRFRVEVQTFRAPFNTAEIVEVEQADEIAYSRCKLCTDLLLSSDAGLYMEIDVLANPDNVSLAVVNFDAGGCSSVTFSPDTGAVIRERKVCEEPLKVQGAYIQPLTTITQGQGFEGAIGLFLRKGHLAFFRRHAVNVEEGEEPELGPWESTGFITDLAWAEGKQLTPCLAFRDEGSYRVRMACVASQPPIMPEHVAMAYEESSWSDLNWDADQEMAEM